MEKLLIIGDSFAADWSATTTVCGWPNKLAEHYDVTNLAQAGCGQYKIYKQLHSVDYQNFDHIVIWHTSPYRIHVLENPIHKDDPLHHAADIIFSDIDYHAKTDKSLLPIMDWFHHYFDLEHAEFIYSLVCDRMLDILTGFPGKVIHCACQNSVYKRLQQQPHFLNFYRLFQPASIEPKSNHFNEMDNVQIYQKLKAIL